MALANMDEDDGGMIIVSGKKKDEDILITIEDNGMGMRERSPGKYSDGITARFRSMVPVWA